MSYRCVSLRKLRIFSLLSITLLLAAGFNLVRAQVTSSMSGRVEDSSGASIPGSRITVTSLETGIERSATADEGGSYRVLSLPVGPYQVKAEREGFKTGIQTGIDLAVG